MLIRYMIKGDDYRGYLAVGLTFLSLGTLGMFIGLSRLLGIFLAEGSTLDFIQGFFVGISGTLLGTAAVFNIRGLWLYGRASRLEN